MGLDGTLCPGCDEGTLVKNAPASGGGIVCGTCGIQYHDAITDPLLEAVKVWAVCKARFDVACAAADDAEIRRGRLQGHPGDAVPRARKAVTDRREEREAARALLHYAEAALLTASGKP